jgi:hypothetical protein
VIFIIYSIGLITVLLMPLEYTGKAWKVDDPKSEDLPKLIHRYSTDDRGCQLRIKCLYGHLKPLDISVSGLFYFAESGGNLVD